MIERSNACKEYYFPYHSKITADDVTKWENIINNQSVDVPTNSGAVSKPNDINSSTSNANNNVTGTTKKNVSETPKNDILDVSIGTHSQCIYPNKKHLKLDDIIANPNIKKRYFLYNVCVMFLETVCEIVDLYYIHYHYCYIKLSIDIIIIIIIIILIMKLCMHLFLSLLFLKQ